VTQDQAQREIERFILQLPDGSRPAYTAYTVHDARKAKPYTVGAMGLRSAAGMNWDEAVQSFKAGHGK
jgi:hypothetical protein